ncbi:acyl-CoA dehydrogenase [Chromatiales bacterium (ex Bugula neritina AB1)]|nr:acyl-CoA dehydrogenase [Chromatiales bacterium (ex Bugula neritina AB1)]
MQADSFTEFKAPVDDILFSLKYIAKAEQLSDWDEDTTRDLLAHFASFAEQVIAPTNRVGDVEGARLIDGRVKLPDVFQSAYRQLAEAGWQGLTAPDDYGGMDVSPVIASGVSEIFSGANHSLQMVCNLVPGAITILNRFGSKEQKQRWIPQLASGQTLSTMCLTEPAAGSDLSAIACRGDVVSESWVINGEKIFISGGDQNISEDILHVVLARTEGGASGIKGLSVFLVCKDPSVKITRIESKLGLHASPTCQMRFENSPAELIGERGQGIQVMFALMNHARIDVALQGVAHAAHAWKIASEYACQRQQSGSYLHQHSDVHRMLCKQQTLAITARSLCHLALVNAEMGSEAALVEFMTSLCKIAGSEAGIESADLGIQILGGYGYLEEYGISQIWRDARITAIYEGTNGIHAKSLVTRGLRKNGGADAFAELLVELADADQEAKLQIENWKKLGTRLMHSNDPLSHSRKYVEATLQVFEQSLWQRIESAAGQHPDSDKMQALIAFHKNSKYSS